MGKRKARKHIFWLWRAQGGVCALCGEEMPFPLPRGDLHIASNPLAPTVDHVVPLSLGGPNIRENMTAVHSVCNFRRGNSRVRSVVAQRLVPLHLMERLREANLREHQWERGIIQEPT